MSRRQLTTDEVVRILRERDPDEDPVVTPTYVAERADVSRPTARNRLREAHGEGKVKTAELSQAGIWWLAEDPITAERAEGIEVVEKEVEKEVEPSSESESEVVTDGAVASAPSQMAEGVDKLLKSNHDMMDEISALRRDLQGRQEQIDELREQREKLREESRELHDERKRHQEEAEALADHIKGIQFAVLLGVVGVTLAVLNAFVPLPGWTQLIAGFVILVGIVTPALLLRSVDTDIGESVPEVESALEE